MPDMKTALTNALSTTLHAWAEDDKPLNQTKEKAMTNARLPIKQPDGNVRFTETVGVARAVFDFVSKNPAVPRQQAVDVLIAKGYKKSSVGSLITQSIRAGVFRLDGHGRLHCEAKAYKPLPAAAKRKLLPIKTKPAPKPVKAIKPKADAGIAALKPATVKFFDPMEFIEQLSVLQAKNVYDRLKQIFGA